jgi:hypothetical protein
LMRLPATLLLIGCLCHSCSWLFVFPCEPGAADLACQHNSLFCLLFAAFRRAGRARLGPHVDAGVAGPLWSRSGCVTCCAWSPAMTASRRVVRAGAAP